MRSRRKTKWSVLVSFMLVLSLFLTACSSGGGGQTKSGNTNEGGGSEGDTKQVLHMAIGEEIPSLNTTIGDDTVSFVAYATVFEGLYTMNSKSELVPAMAVGEPKIEEKDGNFVYTIKLREDAKWVNSKGKEVAPVLAEDYVYAWRQVLKPKSGATYAYLFPTLGVLNADKIMNQDSDLYGKVKELGVKALDKHTLQFTLTKQVPFLKSLLAFPTFYPQPKQFKEEQGDQFCLEPETCLFNGPFIMTEWNHNEGWTYKKNPKYWDKEVVSLDKINYKVVKELSTRVNLYKTDKIDQVTLTGDFVSTLKANPKYKDQFVTSKDTTVYWFLLNLDNKYLKNVNIRKAIAKAWDKEGLTKQLLKDGSIPANFMIPDDFVTGPEGKDFRDVNGDFKSVTYDPEKAKQLWEKGLKELGVDKITLNFLAYEGPSTRKNVEYIVHQLETNLPGLKININQQPFKVMLEKEDSGQFDMAYAGWAPDYLDPMTFLDMWVTESGHNYVGWSNKKYDELIEFAKSNPDKPKERWEAMLKAEQILFSEVPIAPMYQNGAAFLRKQFIKGMTDHPFGPDYTYKYVSIEK